jgi:hypothetical protein
MLEDEADGMSKRQPNEKAREFGTNLGQQGENG